MNKLSSLYVNHLRNKQILLEENNQNIDTAQKASQLPTDSTPKTSKKTSLLGMGLRLVWGLCKWTLVTVITLVIFLTVCLTLPTIQAFLGQRAAEVLSEKLGQKIIIDRLKINFINRKVNLNAITVYDTKDNVLIKAEVLQAKLPTIHALSNGGDIILDDVILENGEVNLTRYKDAERLNIETLIQKISDLTASDTPKDTTKTSVFSIEEGVLKEMAFSYHDARKDSIDSGFDYSHFRLDDLSGTIYDLRVIADTVELQADHLSTIDQHSHLHIKELNTLFRLTGQSMEFRDLFLSANNSTIQKEIVFNFDHIKDMGDFIHKVRIKADLQESVLYTQDLALFAPQLASFDDQWMISTKLDGTINNFYADNLRLGFGNQTFVEGKVRADGLPDINATLANVQVTSSTIDPNDLKKYIDSPQAFDYIDRLGLTSFKGRFDGFVEDFVAQGDFQTALGNVSSDLHLITRGPSPVYKGNIALQSFRMGTFLKRDMVQSMTLKGDVQGQGFDINTLNSKINFDIQNIGVMGYNYQNIKINGEISKRFFDGKLDSKDPNAMAQLAGRVDLRKTINPKDFGDIELKGTIQRIALEKLGISDTPLHITTDMDVHTKGLSLEDIVGKVILHNTSLEYGQRQITFDSLYFYASKNENVRAFDIDSDFLSLNANGNFSFDQLGRQLNTLYKEYNLALQNNAQKIKNYYRRKVRDPYFDLNCSVQLKDVNPLLQLFEPNAYISPNAAFETKFSGGDSTVLQFNTLSPIASLKYKNYKAQNVNGHIESYKSPFKNDILAEINLNSSQQSFNKFETEDLNLNAVWQQNTITFRGGIKQSDTTNHARLEGMVLLEKDSTVIEFLPSYVQLGKLKWDLRETQAQAPHRRIVLLNDQYNRIRFDDITFFNQGKKIILDGTVADSAAHESLMVSVENFDMSMLNQYLDRDLTGSLFAEWNVKDIFEEPKVVGTTEIEGFGIGDIFIGHLTGKTAWDPIENVIKANMNIYGRVDYFVFLDGKYGIKDNSLDFLLELRNAESNILEPFLDQYISDIGGQVSGKVKIKGTLAKPKTKGYFDFNETRFKVNYLGTHMKVSDKVYIYDDEIKLKRFKIYDENGHVAIVDGSIFHHAYDNMTLDLHSKFDNFIFINTHEDENSLYYGTAILSGDVSVEGSVNNINVTGNVTNEYGTKLYFPLDGYTQTSQKDYITFVDFDKVKKDSTQSKIKKLSLSGFTMDLNLDINQDAYMEIIFDKRAGDIIKGRGDGKIQMAINSKGDLSLFGDYFIKKGTYNFTMMNLVNKKFDITDNSRIYFSGSLFDAKMQILASYSQPTSLAPLLDPSIIESGGPELKRRYPTSVLLKLDGPLLSPEINLSIDFKEAFKAIQSPVLRNALISYQALLVGNEQELNRQAFSLILLKTLSSPNSFSGLQASSGRNISEVLSNQLSHWMSQVDENLQIDVDVLSGDANTKDAYQVTLTYTFLDGRLRVTRDGLVDTENQNATANIVGEWTVEYLLTKDGRYRLKMYNRNTPTSYGTRINGNSTTTGGVSISQTHTFNNIPELFGRKPNKEKKEKEKKDGEEKKTSFERQFERRIRREQKREYRKKEKLEN